jgi:hypothetical protein
MPERAVQLRGTRDDGGFGGDNLHRRRRRDCRRELLLSIPQKGSAGQAQPPQQKGYPHYPHSKTRLMPCALTSLKSTSK